MPHLQGTDTTIRVRPLDQWPEGYERREAHERITGPYRVESGRDEDLLEKTISDLDEELQTIEAENVVLQVDVEDGLIRKHDGLPYLRARVDPGVVLTFDRDEATHTMPADRYSDWVQNLRAIYYTLHDLRRISRNGVGTGSEQYRGFQALPPAGETTTTMTSREAAVELARMTPLDADQLLEDPNKVSHAFRLKAKWAHPDQGGDQQQWLKILDARKTLSKHHGLPG